MRHCVDNTRQAVSSWRAPVDEGPASVAGGDPGGAAGEDHVHAAAGQPVLDHGVPVGMAQVDFSLFASSCISKHAITKFIQSADMAPAYHAISPQNP